jgi:hypothetical protein
MSLLPINGTKVDNIQSVYNQLTHISCLLLIFLCHDSQGISSETSFEKIASIFDEDPRADGYTDHYI